METVTRIFEFDAAHRVMNERVKCFNLHGHRFKVEITFGYNKKAALGYAIDFKEIKRIVGAYIDEHLDHACILNPFDKELIDLCKKNGWRVHTMGMGRNEDINPSAENLASELFYIVKQLFIKDRFNIWPTNIRLYETPNCWVDADGWSIVPMDDFINNLNEWRNSKGEMNYDIREEK